MTENERKQQQFGVELFKLAAAVKGAQLTEPLVQVFWEEFADVEAADFVAACKKARRTCDFFPSVREFRALLPHRPKRDVLLERLLAGFERQEPWPERRLLGTPEFPTPRPDEKSASELDRAIEARMRAWRAGSELP
jgi:hypothetical protein